MTTIWLAVDEDGKEVISDTELCRNDGMWWSNTGRNSNVVEVPKGTIEKILGRKLTWEDEAVEVGEKTKCKYCNGFGGWSRGKELIGENEYWEHKEQCPICKGTGEVEEKNND